MGITHIPERNYDNRSIVHSTPRYRGTTTCFSSQDDDQTDPTAIWGGSNKLALKHKIGDPATQTIYMDFNTITNRTYVLTGMMSWENCDFDEWSCAIVPKTTAYSAGTNTNYDLYGGYLIIPAAGTGSITVNDADRVLVQIPQNEYGERASGGYWDADFNTTTKQFENITPNIAGTGEYNMFGSEVVLSKFVPCDVINGTHHNSLTAYDAEQMGHGMRLKFIFMTNTSGADHDWCFTGRIAMFRDKTT